MFTSLFSWIVGLSWLLMYGLGLISCVMAALAYFSFTGVSFPRIKALMLSLCWFVTFPVYAGYLLWTKKDQIKALAGQLKMMQQMQEHLAVFSQLNQLSSGTAPEGETFDQRYE